MKYLIVKTLKGDKRGYTMLIDAKSKAEAKNKSSNGKGRIKSITRLGSNLKGGE